MSNEPQYYFHVGLPKTASTYLQVFVFPALEGIRYFRKRHYKKYKSLPGKANEKLLFTNERDVSLFKELEIIKKHCPQAKIIVVFREHFSWITSKYKYHLRKNGPLYFDEFYDQKLVKERGLNKHYYRNIVEKIESLFPGRFQVLIYDELKKNPRRFNKKLLHFLGVEQEPEFKNTVVKPAFTSRQLYVIRKFNQTFRYKPSSHPKKWRRKLHYKVWQFSLHIVAQLSHLNFWNTTAIDKEIEKNREKLQAYFKEDWDYVCELSDTHL
jgi:hypothetical protein